LSLKFYLPNFEDLVDPEYDFINDRPSPKRGDRYAHDRYAHEFFGDESIFDGVLMSKTVVTPSIEKRIRKEGGVHAFMRLDRKYPVMGDCGAFTYREQAEPPYATDEILDYYQSLGFDYGVSIDHLIFSGFPLEEQERRWQLTLRNAEDFLRRHGEKGCSFVPVGIAQGPTPERYAAAIRRLVELGYSHLALGGLARSYDKDIRQVLEAVSPELPTGTELHLFGVARLSLIPDFLRYGVTSADSASPIRRAFMGDGGDNYWTADDERYAAIRVAEATSQRKKRGVDSPTDIVNGSQPVDSIEALVELEQAALWNLRAFDRCESSLEKTLDAVLGYDRLFGEDRNHERLYRRVLEDRPWQKCDCPICKEVGVEVIIFRSNNRNRRRGFHNARVFYQQFRTKVSEIQLGQLIANDPPPRQLALALQE
jgi:hypothetical protein